MKLISLLFFALCLILSGTEAFARGGMGGMGSHMSMGSGLGMGGALGTSAATPGTNSLGTALPSSGVGGHAMKGPPLGTNPAIDQEDAQLQKMIESSICRGC
ncbi:MULTISPECIES: hypothetical protein [unclassified Bradyrhizobium]|uniref:hypothetical protein n=1 Tax=unclassified Bradyrhizobium TaxID=2631580 RepID=UPI00048C0606|nr:MULTISPECIES: hypothetical protein [unclassified Bradyrhizobium]QIG98246.1 hypothetical protein G6P99_42715 [Bradyrhizobium sp. 6(2017)]